MSDSNHTYSAAFLACLFPRETAHTYQTFHDQVKGQPGTVVHGELAQLAPFLAAQQSRGHGVFFTVNRTDGAGRELANITAIRAVWLDIDEAGRDTAPICAALRPHAVVESSPGKHHLYWRVDDLPLPEGQLFLRALRERWGGDPGATGINRVMRLPGFWHLKSSTPHMTRIADWAPDMGPYQRAHIVHYLLGGVDPAIAPAAETDSTGPLQAGPVEGWRDPISDDELMARLNGQKQGPRSAAEAFGGGWSLHELWAPDMATLQAEGTRSQARLSLLTRLMYLTGGDQQRVHDLVQGHPLAIKDDRQSLLVSELHTARRTFLAWWGPELAKRQAQAAETRALAEAAGPEAEVLVPVWTAEEMRAKLVYISKSKGVVVRATKQILKFDDAAAHFAASTEQIVKPGADKATSAASLSLWLAGEGRITAGLVTWQPGAPEICAPLDHVDNHATACNTWRGLPAYTPPDTWRDWAAWFTHHVEYLVPVESERVRFLQWLGHMVQHPGELPHTCYLMVTEMTGTGRNWLASVLARVMTGYCALGVPLGPILDGKFNGILSHKLLATVDEVREGMDGRDYQRAEALKTLINQEVRQIDHKYGMQVVEKNCCRWLIFSNHKRDALPFDANDRRINVIENPSERRSEDYYRQLYSLLSAPQLVASVRHYLQTLDLAGFNPGAPATLNAAKRELLDGMTGALDKACAEFVRVWPAAVAAQEDLKQFAAVYCGEPPRAVAMRHAMARAGIKPVQAVTIGGVPSLLLQVKPGHVDDPVATVLQARAAMAF